VELSPQELESRKQVWVALSDLFLDTDVSLLREHDAKILASSPYSLLQLERILTEEVCPVCKWNLFSVAGEWVGFDEEWLVASILKRRNWFMRAWSRWFGKLDAYTSRDWHLLRSRVEELRATP